MSHCSPQNNRKKNNNEAFFFKLQLQSRLATFVSHQRAKLHDQQIGSDL